MSTAEYPNHPTVGQVGLAAAARKLPKSELGAHLRAGQRVPFYDPPPTRLVETDRLSTDGLSTLMSRKRARAQLRAPFNPFLPRF